MCLKSALNLNLKQYRQYMQQIGRKIEAEIHRIEQTGHLFPYWLVLWNIVLRMFLPAMDSRQFAKLLEVGRDWYWKAPVSGPISRKKKKKNRYRIKPYPLTVTTQLSDFSFQKELNWIFESQWQEITFKVTEPLKKTVNWLQEINLMLTFIIDDCNAFQQLCRSCFLKVCLLWSRR